MLYYNCSLSSGDLAAAAAAMTHKVFNHKILGILKTLSGQNSFHTRKKTFFAFFTVLTFALIMQKQWCVKLLSSLHISR